MFKVRSEVMEQVSKAHAAATPVIKNQQLDAAQEALDKVSQALESLKAYHTKGFWGVIFRFIDFIKGTGTTLKTEKTALESLLGKKPEPTVNAKETDKLDAAEEKEWDPIKAKIDQLINLEDSDERREQLIKLLEQQGSYNEKNGLHIKIVDHFVLNGQEDLLTFFKSSTGSAPYERMFLCLAKLPAHERLLNQLFFLPAEDIQKYLPIWLDNGPKQKDFDAAQCSEKLNRAIIARAGPGQGEAIKGVFNRIIEAILNKGIIIKQSKDAFDLLETQK